MEYNFYNIEKKWQKYWLEHQTFRAEDTSSKPKYYILDMFPYPSGNGLHVGHPEGYTATDILARYKRMRGFNVLHPMGWDAFGLPAEQYAVKTGTHPEITTKKNVDHFREQIRSLGFSYDWSREVNTTDPKYYRWTQWIFLKLYEKGLAYESSEPVNWCPALGTVLANEEVIDGKSEVGGFPVIKKPMRQWVLKITEYAQRLLDDLEDLDWPESVKQMQKNWIGKSQGALVEFEVEGSKDRIQVFTTRADTLFGASFLVLAPEHPLVSKLTTKEQEKECKAYVDRTLARSDRDRISDTTKTGVFLGSYAINPVNGERLPIYIADYVLTGYGCGAIMAVPAHDDRDYEFAKKFNLPIRQVLRPKEGEINLDKEAFCEDGILVNSSFLDGLGKDEAIAKMISYLEEKKIGRAQTTYKLRDWLFSRQRYWGEPFPIMKDKDGRVVTVSEEDLPVLLPEVESFTPSADGEPPLSKAKEWLTVKGKDGSIYTRETNTMPQWAGSCWYYLRYLDPQNDKAPWDPKKEKYWMPVDLYIGGAEHAVLHLLYARFWHKVLYDLGYVSTKEPFLKLVNQGMILGENGEKMSKSRGNVINPDDVVAEWGADSMRLYEMFMGPLEAVKPWQTKGISGVFRFLKRTWNLFIDQDSTELKLSSFVKGEKETDREVLSAYHKTLKKVSEDLDNLRFNTAISSMMELVNLLYKKEGVGKDVVEGLVLMLSPFAPHMCEEIYSCFVPGTTLAYVSWPQFDPEYVKEDLITISVQVNGRLRATVEHPVDATRDTVIELAKKNDSVARHLEGKTIRKEIYVPGKIVNFVVG